MVAFQTYWWDAKITLDDKNVMMHDMMSEPFGELIDEVYAQFLFMCLGD
jgi:hypothetical protein